MFESKSESLTKHQKVVGVTFIIAFFMLLSHGIGSGLAGGTYSFSKVEDQKYYLYGNAPADVIPGKQWHQVTQEVYIYSMIHEYALYLSWGLFFISVITVWLIGLKWKRNNSG